MKKRKSGHSRTRESADARRLAIESLLAGASQESTARAAHVSCRTIRRWLADAAFCVELEKGRTLAFEDALGALKGGAAIAVKTLLQNLTAKSPGERRQAAKEILTFCFKGVEAVDFEARLKHVEELLEAGGIEILRAGRVS